MEELRIRPMPKAMPADSKGLFVRGLESVIVSESLAKIKLTLL